MEIRIKKCDANGCYIDTVDPAYNIHGYKGHIG